MLSVLFGLSKFHHYTYGRDVTVVTDHKPLVAIRAKPLGKAPKRLQHMLLKSQEYSYQLTYKPGKAIPVADALSRAPTDDPVTDEVAINNITLTASIPERLDRIRGATLLDPVLQELDTVIMEGWPNDRRRVPDRLLPYFSYRDELTIQDGIIFRGERIVIPSSLRKSMKEKVHAGHIGINSSLRRARDLIYWPQMSTDIRYYVETCGVCATDYHSGFFELDYLPDTTSETVVGKLKNNFSRHGIPHTLVSDNGPQYASAVFRIFAQNWHFVHETSSPGNSQANGAAEAAVKIAKRMLRKCKASKEDPYLGLLNIRNTPTEGMATSPAQRLFGRRTKTLLPTTHNQLKPGGPADFREQSGCQRTKFKSVLNSDHPRRDLRRLNVGETIRMQPLEHGRREWTEATVHKALSSRSYDVITATGRHYRRNRRHLRPSRPSEQDTTHDRADRPERMIPPSGVPRDRAHDPETVTVETNAASTQQQETTTVTQNTRLSKVVVPEDTREHDPMTTRSGRVVRPVDRLKL